MTGKGISRFNGLKAGRSMDEDLDPGQYTQNAMWTNRNLLGGTGERNTGRQNCKRSRCHAVEDSELMG